MRILVVGSGAREHTLAWKLHQSPTVDTVFVAPGNAGTAQSCCNLNVGAGDLAGIVAAARANRVDLVVVGPEAPLAAGLVDRLAEAGVPAFGPTAAAAAIESSKVFARELMERHGVPCAAGRAFDDARAAIAYIEGQAVPIVVKADGLAAGKGVVVAQTTAEAIAAVEAMMEQRVFGAAGERVVVEECLVGREVSLLAFADGETVRPMVPACDYKRVARGNRGPNTGGMGAFSPPSFFGPDLVELALSRILKPTVRALAAAGRPFRGVLYAGLMVTATGLRVLEFNCRFGDPEAQVVLPRLDADLAAILADVVEGRLDRSAIRWTDDACVGVVLASEGYPGTYPVGRRIDGLAEAGRDALIFHAGTRLGPDGVVETAGGRVLTVAACAPTIAEARRRAYAGVTRIHFQGCHYRTDIAESES
ncbi:MAG: phosphoribosylamine--glycine ligase [Chloroflexi bacterium]|nr:phosphoribosylamine--glycine ligase [Chloroflexota bacterium]